MTILVFDSGIGGLSVLREARMIMHDHRFVYVGDDAGFPYGDWDGAALTERMVGLFETLIEQFNPCLAIVACNTASTLIMPSLRSRFDIPFVGIVPAIKPAAERTASGLITVLATPGTVKRPYTLELIQKFAKHRQVNLVGATRLARLSEEHMQGRSIDTEVLRAEIAPCFVENEGKRTDIITLGCTHYPFLVNEMRKLAPWPVDWLDPAEAVARQACHVLSELPQSTSSQIAIRNQALARKPAFIQNYVSDQAASLDKAQAVTHALAQSRPLSQGSPQSDIAIMTSNSPPASIVRLLASFGLQRHTQEFLTLHKQ